MRKNYLLTSLCSMFLFTSCAPYYTESPDFYEERRKEQEEIREQNRWNKKSFGNFYVTPLELDATSVTISDIKTKDEVIEEALIRAKLNFVEGQELLQLEKKLKHTSQGYISIKVEALSIELASNPVYNIVIRNTDNKTVKTCIGPNDIADGSVDNNLAEWINFIYCDIPSGVEGEFKVYLVDIVRKQRSGYLVEKK